MGVSIETFVITTFLIILGFSAVNLIISSFIFWSSRKAVYLKMVYFWGALIVNFMIQSQSQGNESVIINGFGFTMIPLSLLAYASLAFTSFSFPKKVFLPLLPFSAVATFLLMDQDLSFTSKAMPYALTGALPLFYTAFIYLVKARAETTPLMKFHAVVLVFLALHSFNFAFFRMEPEAQLWGWPVAYALYQLLAGLLPALTLEFYHREEGLRLKSIIEKKTSSLQEANASLKRVADQKNYLFRTLTHDISTPLSIARMKIELFQRRPSDIKKFTCSISDIVLRMEQLVAQVQVFAASEGSQIQVATQETSLVECLSEVEELFKDRLEAKAVSISYDKSFLENVRVQVDKQSFVNSVLSNIISNAIKFCQENGKIEVFARNDCEGQVTLSIKDNGIGMPEGIREKLFDFDAKTSRLGTQSEKGTGFGAPIVAKIVESYGGRVKVLSKEKENEIDQSFTQFDISLRGTMNIISQAS